MSSFNDFFFYFKGLVKGPTCRSNRNNPPFIELFLTNPFKSFILISVIKTGLSDFDKLIVKVLITTFQKMPSRILIYWNYKKLKNKYFCIVLDEELIRNEAYACNFTVFDNILMEIKKKHAQIMKKVFQSKWTTFRHEGTSQGHHEKISFAACFLRNKPNESHNAFKEQRNECANLLKLQIKRN